MEVKPVVAAVTSKLADTLKEKTIANNKVMIHQLKGVQKSLTKLQSFSEEKDVSRDHLRIIYEVEDEIEKFTFRVARQKKRFGFLMKHTFFFNNLNSCRRLKRKIKKVQTIISTSHVDEAVTSTKPSTNKTLSLNSKDDDNDVDSCYETNEIPRKSSSSLWPISEIPCTPSPKKGSLARSFTAIPNYQEKKKLTFNYSFNEEEMSIVGFKQMSNFSYHEEELGVFGLNDDIKSLLKRLTHEMKQKEMFIPIIGEAGSGKTTLARAVYKKRKIQDHFEVHDWISVTEEYTADCIKGKVLKRASAVKGKRYLLVVDGIGNCSMLQDLKDAFTNEDNGSKVIFTSRGSPEMKMSPHIMSGLKEEELWRMFMKKAGMEKEADQIKPRLKYKILNICRGLPLNILLMAGLLSNKRITRWSSAIQYKLEQDNYQCSDEVLSICYNDLSSHSKLCVSYMALFPKDYDIPVRRLLRLWLAEGFVERKSQSFQKAFPEDLAQKYFEELVDRRLIQMTKLRSDKSPRQCRLVSVFHDYLLPKATDTSLFYIHRNLENISNAAGNFGVRRIVQHMSTAGSVDLHQSHIQTSKFDPSLLRSYVSFNFQRKDMPEKDAGHILGRVVSSKFRLLRVLDLEGVYIPSLPNKLGHLCQLRYLGLRWTSLDSLPDSVGDLSYLETLDVKHTNIDSLPDSIWKLKKLRHLNLNNIRLAMPPSRSLTLVTLWGLVLDEKISINEGLGKLLDLRELGIKFELSTTSQDVLLDWIAKLVNLRSLRLTSINNMARPLKLVLKPLMTLEKLSHLNLYGNLQRLPSVDEFPPTLKVLTLSISLLNNDPMETLEKLPCLIVLRLLGDSFTGKRMVCHRGGFKELRVLKLWSLKELEQWDVEEEAMENLKELNIRCCSKLNDIPSRLLQKQKCLEELTLKDMPEDFVARIKKRKSKDTSLATNPWKFTPLDGLRGR